MSHSHSIPTSSSNSNFQVIFDNALKVYEKRTKQNLRAHPLASRLQDCNSSDKILAVLQQQVRALDQFRSRDDRWSNWLGPTVNILHTLSETLGEGVSRAFPPAKAIFVGIDVLLSTAKDVHESRDTLIDVFERIESFLQRLEIYKKVQPTKEMIDTLVQIMVQVLSILGIATKEIKEGRIKMFGKKLIGRNALKDSLKKLDKLTHEEARMVAAELLRTTNAIRKEVRGVGEQVTAVGDGVAIVNHRVTEVIDNGIETKQVIKQAANDVVGVKRDQLRLDVQRWLSAPDPSMNHNSVWKTQHSGTAEWFFKTNSLIEWKARGSLLWIHGKPGAGKTTLLSAIIQDIEGMQKAGLATMAYYYFDCRDVTKQNCYGLLSSFLSHLSSQSDSCFNTLSQLYSDHGYGMRKPDIVALKKCMTDMLSFPGQTPTYIVVDAIDECPKLGMPSAREEVLELIEELVDLKLQNVHLCVASRPEADIRMVLEPLTSLKISLHDEIGQKEDIIKYIKSVVHSDRSMRRWTEEIKQLVIETLSDRADGMFRWVVCQIDKLRRCFPASIRSALAELPDGLDETYEQMLLGIDKMKRKYAHQLFKCLSVSIRPLRVEELAEILAFQFDEGEFPTFDVAWRLVNAEEDAILSACSSLITIVDMGGSRVVQFSHSSVKDFLTSKRLATAENRLSFYHILHEPAHTILARAALSVLLQLDDKIDKDTIDQFPLAPYAARYWVNHAQFRNVSSHIQEVMKRLFDPKNPHFSAWVWLYDIDRHWIEPMVKIRPTRPEAVPLYYAALSGFRGLVEHLIAANSQDVNSRGGSHTYPLHAALFKGHLEVASLLLENGADPNSRDNLGKVPLHKVPQGRYESSLKIARLLVASGAGVAVTDDEGWTPLHAAARSGHRDNAELLLDSGASFDVQNKREETPLDVACGNGRLDVSRLLIVRGSDINSQDKNGFVPLITASRYGHLDIAQLLLDCGSDVNVCEPQSWTPLHYASRHGNLGLARLLIDHNADINAQKVDRWTPMHLASSNGNLDIVKLLVKQGAKLDSPNDKEETPLDLASGNGHLDIARFLIESGATVTSRDNKGWTPFHTASNCGHLDIVKFLLLERGIDVDIRTRDEQTPLYLASCNGMLDVVCFLIERGADIHTTDHKGWNPVHIASQNEHLDVVRKLINIGIAVDIRNGSQKTPLALASRKGKVEVGRFLIERGADVNARDNESWAPLHLASRFGHLEMVRLLLDKGADKNVQKTDLWSPLHLASKSPVKVSELLIQCDAEVDMLNDKQETPLHRAAVDGKVAIARLLIDNGANINSTDSNGWTPLHTASYRGNLGVVKLLLRLGANVNVRNKASKTADDLASENGQAVVARLIAEYKSDADIRNRIRSSALDAQYISDERRDEGQASLHAAAEEGNADIVKSLLGRRMDINGRNARNETPLDRAARKGNLDVVRLLIGRGAEVDSRDMCGWTPLHKASRFGHVEVSRMLVDNGANVNATHQNNRTPLDLSARSGHPGIVKLLLEHGANVNTLNDEGETPLQLSLRKGLRGIANLLQEHGAGKASESTA